MSPFISHYVPWERVPKPENARGCNGRFGVNELFTPGCEWECPGVSVALQRFVERIDARDAKVVIVGQGYVGLPIAVRASELGFRVVGYDTERERIDALRAGSSYVEDVPEAALRAAIAAGFHPTCDPLDLRGFDVAIITVPTPLRDGSPDLSFIEAAGQDVASRLAPGALVVL